MKEYISTKQLQEITGLSYKSAMNVIDGVRKEMIKKNYYLPKCKTKLALTWMVKEKIGIKGE